MLQRVFCCGLLTWRERGLARYSGICERDSGGGEERREAEVRLESIDVNIPPRRLIGTKAQAGGWLLDAFIPFLIGLSTNQARGRASKQASSTRTANERLTKKTKKKVQLAANQDAGYPPVAAAWPCGREQGRPVGSSKGGCLVCV